MIWFVQQNYFKSKQYLPRFYQILGNSLQKIGSLCSHKAENYSVKTESIKNKSKASKFTKQNAKSIEPEQHNGCERNKENEEKPKNKINIEKNLDIINHSFFLSMFLINVIIQLAIWCS